ncbi:MAG: TFIIB-type zinc finger domain-containing protein [Clostridia bacterium]|nr:TFIIB-type zinc finger domain-containing protein [Clostridia bacterium]
MKKLICEMCGSSDMVKQDGLFVCQSCGMKYSVEEAKKMMIDGTVEVQGTVKIDHANEMEHLYKAARNARKALNHTTAIRHYELIQEKDPNSWEALFYLTVLRTESIKYGEVNSAAISIRNCLDEVFHLLKEYVSDTEERKNAVQEIGGICISKALSFSGGTQHMVDDLARRTRIIAFTGIYGFVQQNAAVGEEIQKYKIRCINSAAVTWLCADCIEKYFGLSDDTYKACAAILWETAKGINDMFKEKYRSDIFADVDMQQLYSKIMENDPDYEREKREKEQQNKKIKENARTSKNMSCAAFALVMNILTLIMSIIICIFGAGSDNSNAYVVISTLGIFLSIAGGVMGIISISKYWNQAFPTVVFALSLANGINQLLAIIFMGNNGIAGLFGMLFSIISSVCAIIARSERSR